MLGMSSDTAGS